MSLALDIVRIVLPVVIVGGIGSICNSENAT